MTNRSSCAAETGCACVPQLTTPADRIAALQTLLAAEHEPVVALTQLLRLCRDEHPTLWEHHADPRCRARVEQCITEVAALLPEPGAAPSISIPARAGIAQALTSDPDVPAVVMAHALAELIDAHYGHTFAGWFRGRSPYQPAVGDPIPLDHPDLRRITDLAPTAPPWRLANRLDETRGLRLAGAWATQFRVVFDYAAFDGLEDIISEDTVIATCHPNRDLDELGLAAPHRGPAFPVQPVDPDAQRVRIEGLLRDATDAGATVVVLPELSVTPALAAELEVWVRRPGPLRLLVAGTYHVTDADDPARRSNRALAWIRGHAEPLTQDKHSPADRPVIEDITPTGWPEIRVHVTADGWHVVIAVCRDLLNPGAVHALAESGVNLVLAPAMTDATMPFGGPVAQLVGTGQAIVAVANNPCSWAMQDRPSPPSPARAIFGHPGFTQQTRQVHAGDDEPGIALLHVRSGRLRWHPAHMRREPSAPAGDGKDAPTWAALLRQRTSAAAAPAPAPASLVLRTAAVLVVLSDGRDGPEALLTTRAPELTHYPEQTVFPGGSSDPGDSDIVDTALREANEEIGLDPHSVHVIGTFPSIGLPASGFLVTPVLAWSSDLRLVHGPNPAEVGSIQRMPLRHWRTLRDVDTEATPVGAMTAMVLDLLAGVLCGAGSPPTP
jgi:8-oxo-dGTP pyrophosphatase MutT (NUDIX family)